MFTATYYVILYPNLSLRKKKKENIQRIQLDTIV
ncbi:hypothetical protein VCRA2121O441_70043 [Vibrio crassostreae]|nr:hypothetical protein VCRA2113O416_20043 [Vibrio crassostreae]CAK2148077.1 hypothetical protein VCRA2113O412_60043 [Vibrio crassostreae]CAK2149133.1 hypothetical protein VCRA2113O414_60043 [Vibrio crassostreae]CAK2169014.1 hypothetical protein VCRA2113O418_70043 [Vibrio crassostreae]CAK2185546.1 hypothetical protein VCRA2114O423_80043 [Vibrio crassostreae]